MRCYGCPVFQMKNNRHSNRREENRRDREKRQGGRQGDNQSAPRRGTHWGSRGAPFGEGTLSPLRRYLKPLPKGGTGGEGGVNEEPKPP